VYHATAEVVTEDTCSARRAWDPATGRQLGLYTVPKAAADPAMRPKTAALGHSKLPSAAGDPEHASAAAAAQDQMGSANNGINEDVEASADEQVSMQIRGWCDMLS